MPDDFQLVPLPTDADSADLFDSGSYFEEKPPEKQYCIFRSGRERFCLSAGR